MFPISWENFCVLLKNIPENEWDNSWRELYWKGCLTQIVIESGFITLIKKK